ncbi:hypothetical protein LEL_00180 [Akanthomyces lecanii RCEF 1005]|uniref:DUF7136 domain-containing protein n=1 Tax=Akanthomyces lecanii RCEF 1005 TaxID=1081108 RepID=A0A168JMK1_CORDF|nr:hypothetical protein LEL_00180 [Akanthomyces lecanii RCEF 1005]
MRFFPALLLACTSAIWPAAVLGERNLPATVLVDLRFPRNEMYKPAPWFPPVLAVKGLEDVWPFPRALDMSIISASSTLGVDAPSYRNFDMSFSSLDFRNSPDGEVPDIEESIRACPKPKPESSVALRISGIFTMPIYAPEVEHQDQCSVFEVTKSAVCPYKDVAALVAKNVSDTVLNVRHCSQCAWQDPTEDCEEKQNTASLLGAKADIPVFWSSCLILATVVVNGYIYAKCRGIGERALLALPADGSISARGTLQKPAPAAWGSTFSVFKNVP